MIRTLRLQHVFGLITAALVVLVGFGQAQAGILINEVSLNNEGGDNGEEFFELISDTGGAESMSGLTLVIIDGDGTSRGTIDQALSVGAFSTGTNGLFLWRDSALVLAPAPDAATTLNVADFVPDIENGTGTFALVTGFDPNALGLDLDPNNENAITVAVPWSSVVDSVGVLDGTAGDHVYAAGLGGVDLASASYAADSIVRLSDTGEWIAIDIDEVASEIPGPYSFDDTQAQRADGTSFTPSSDLTFNTLTPGSTNPANVPEPASALLLGFAGLLLAGSRRSVRKA